ncbi:hypothetical protein DPMN_054102 [Dreissena polymorpha]|uniref:Uncharacterized protein n=1 Tax=Dreissena polymorpha TaxID=45954 RepID=A0A9D4HRB7_DREPO|nr:hypothetical protein DPMN_054102 [Dreissena polymorpha]
MATANKAFENDGWTDEGIDREAYGKPKSQEQVKDRHTYRQAHIHTDKRTHRQTHIQTNKQTDKQTNRQTGTHAPPPHTHTKRQTQKGQTDRQTDGQTERPTIRQTEMTDGMLNLIPLR